MKNFKRNIILALFGLCIVFLFCGVECTQSKDDPNTPPPEDLCGPKDYKVRIWSMTFEPYDPAQYYLETIDGRVYYQYSLYVSEACHKKHAKVSCQVIKTESSDVGITPRADYSLFYQVPGVFHKDEHDAWVAEIDFGMQHAFADDQAAFFWGMVIISCPEQETTEEDLKYFRENIQNVSIRCDFYKYKAPAM